MNAPMTKKELKQAKWLKEPIAIIQRPLRFLKDKLTSEAVDKETGATLPVISPLYFMARDFAKIGDGASVRAIARNVLGAK